MEYIFNICRLPSTTVFNLVNMKSYEFYLLLTRSNEICTNSIYFKPDRIKIAQFLAAFSLERAFGHEECKQPRQGSYPCPYMTRTPIPNGSDQCFLSCVVLYAFVCASSWHPDCRHRLGLRARVIDTVTSVFLSPKGKWSLFSVATVGSVTLIAILINIYPPPQIE